MAAQQKPRIEVSADLSALVEAAAEHMATRLAAVAERAAVCLTGGSTPEPVYRRLAAAPYRDTIPWERIHLFWGDDRFVPADDARNNAGMTRRALVDHVPIPPANVHPVPTGEADQHAAARAYEDALKRFYGADRLDPARPLFDFVLMGLGSDGHTASLFPGSPALSERERWVVGVDKAGLEPFVPRVTLTYPALASTREMLFLISGKGKRDIVARVLGGADLPAARARADGAIVWMMDRAAAEASDGG